MFDLSAINEAKAEGFNLAAARHSNRSARDLVVLVAANAYLQVMATSRARDVRAEPARDRGDAAYVRRSRYGRAASSPAST